MNHRSRFLSILDNRSITIQPSWTWQKSPGKAPRAVSDIIRPKLTIPAKTCDHLGLQLRVSLSPLYPCVMFFSLLGTRHFFSSALSPCDIVTSLSAHESASRDMMGCHNDGTFPGLHLSRLFSVLFLTQDFFLYAFHLRFFCCFSRYFFLLRTLYFALIIRRQNPGNNKAARYNPSQDHVSLPADRGRVGRRNRPLLANAESGFPQD